LALTKSASSDTEAVTISAAPSSGTHNQEAEIEEELTTYRNSIPQIAIKLAVTNRQAGIIIGKSGATISELQEQSRTRIKLSQSCHYYPGTTDRICLIQGSLANTKVAIELIFLKLYKLQVTEQVQQQSTPKDTSEEVQVKSDSETANELLESFLIKLLVPAASCGMIIGRSGYNLKKLKNDSGVSNIQLSQRGNDDISALTSERILTIAGPNFSSCVHCVYVILDDVATHPEIFRYTNKTTHYSQAMATDQQVYAQNEMTISSPAFDEPSILQPLHYPDEIYDASIPQAYTPYLQDAYASADSPFLHSQVMTEFGSLTLSSPASDMMSSVESLGGIFQGHSVGSPAGISRNFNCTCQIGIPEKMVGCIMGQGGKILMELQSQTMTRIHLSDRGEYFPGTDQRIVTISGPSEESIANVQYLIGERLSAYSPRNN
jgi:RNA-binding protein Nova